MKKTGIKKLSLKIETLTSLTPDVLDGVNGGQAGVITTTRTVVTKLACPTRLACPPKTLVGCTVTVTKPNAGGEG